MDVPTLRKRARDATNPLDDFEHKRTTKNQREQNRGQQISSLISELQELLEEAGVNVGKPTKIAVLSETVKFVRSIRKEQKKKR